MQLATAQPGSAIGGDPATVFDAVAIPGALGDVDLYVKKSVFPHAFANDLPIKTAAVLAAVQRPVAFSALVAPSGDPAWKTIPSWYLVGTADNVIPPAQQRIMAARAHAHTVEVRASHLPMVSRPADVTRLILTRPRPSTESHGTGHPDEVNPRCSSSSAVETPRPCCAPSTNR